MKNLALLIVAVSVIFCNATAKHSAADWEQTDGEIQVILSVSDEWVNQDDRDAQVTLSMSNPAHKVKAIQTDIASSVPGCTSNCDVDYLICTHCAPDRDRAAEFTCSADDLGDGKCRIILFGNNPVDLIEEGSGPIATIDYDVSEDAPSSDCIDITPSDSMASDRFGNPLFVGEEADELCFIVCGDVYPRDCLGQCQCGDGVVDIFDILEEVDFVLEVTSPSDCQLLNADVPTGQSPYCSERDGIIDIFDILVLLDMALGKYNNCCDDIFFPCVYC